MFADEALPDAHSPKQSTAAAQEGILHNRGERALVRSASKGEVEPLNAFDKTRPLDDIEVIRKRSCTRRTSDLHASLILGTTLHPRIKVTNCNCEARAKNSFDTRFPLYVGYVTEIKIGQALIPRWGHDPRPHFFFWSSGHRLGFNLSATFSPQILGLQTREKMSSSSRTFASI